MLDVDYSGIVEQRQNNTRCGLFRDSEIILDVNCLEIVKQR